EGGLGEHDAQRARDEQLEPAVPQQDEAREAAGERQGEPPAEQGVEPVCPLQQAACPDRLGDLGVRLRQVGERRPAAGGPEAGAQVRSGAGGSAVGGYDWGRELDGTPSWSMPTPRVSL